MNKKSKPQTVFICQECGAQFSSWMGRCSDCQAWNSLVETIVSPVKTEGKLSTSGRSVSKPQALSAIEKVSFERIKSGIAEFDRVLGGGIVPGSVTLVAGEPGIGKSTLILQIADCICKVMADRQTAVLYVSGEESPHQIKIRAERLKISHPHLFLLSETNVEAIIAEIEQTKPAFVIVDSIQSLYSEDLNGIAGSIGQVRDCANKLLHATKYLNVPLFLIGHVTKEGFVAGPKTLEHMVDTVIYLEGERTHSYRTLRGVKNRFGATDEVGIFEITEGGMVEVTNPSALFLSEWQKDTPGSVVTSVVEGNRPMLVEIQALASPSFLSIPRRTTSGIDYNRLLLLIAVLTTRCGFKLHAADIYINVAGGLRLKEPGTDLGVCLAIASSLRNKAINPKTIAIGEVGLLGEIRKVGQTDKRVKEAKKLGFDTFITPENTATLSEAIRKVFS